MTRIRYRVEPDRTGFLRAARLSILSTKTVTAEVRDGLSRRTVRLDELHETRAEAWAAWRQGIKGSLAGLREDRDRVVAEIERLEDLLAKHGGKG